MEINTSAFDPLHCRLIIDAVSTEVAKQHKLLAGRNVDWDEVNRIRGKIDGLNDFAKPFQMQVDPDMQPKPDRSQPKGGKY